MKRVLGWRAKEQGRIPYASLCKKMEAKRQTLLDQETEKLQAEEGRKQALLQQKLQKEAEELELKLQKEAEERANKKDRVTTKTVVDVGPNFKYFESQLGLKFLLETGNLEPDSRIEVKEKIKMPELDIEGKRKVKSIWQPRLVDEAEERYIDTEQLFEASIVDFPSGYERAVAPGHNTLGGEGGFYYKGENGFRNPDEGGYEGEFGNVDIHSGPPPTGGIGPIPGLRKDRLAQGGELAEDLLYPNPEEDRNPSRPSSPVGPHPDKKGSHWDVYGQKRMVGKLISKAYVEVNEKYFKWLVCTESGRAI